MVQAIRDDPNDSDVETVYQAYEKAYVAWSIERPITLLLFRDLLSSENYALIENKFSESLEGQILRPMRLCPATSLGHGDNRAAINDTFDACQIDELLELSSKCSLAMAAAVSDLVETPSEWASIKYMEEQQKQARKSIREQCP